MTYYLTEEQIIYLNAFLIRTYSPNEDVGVKEAALLNSAVNRPKQSAFGRDAYPTIFKKAAALFQSLSQNHPFFNANKRTAFAALEAFLEKNGYTLSVETQEEIDFTVEIADQENKIDINEISIWIKHQSNRI
ncbi:type II toxin-antitoxin system death-on-curing family toxin [Sporolactobacillus shoreae]|uniref:Type II toxin-antitoxin system death-on-curing family toxin n=1 Tax=Sporolactobacillus shoreae TaxID=1465501 RepID=A0A4Z0GG81_9BACL|nr:type II toxin-antitoxin system death-on-curing family toxin [Sporolactobacillus shoreae]TGA95493.1 type II toxin-antitoxin system death-on-curing family toxin [Sporolactobacillus shoreae]